MGIDQSESMSLRSTPQGPENAQLRAGSIGVGGIVFFVLSAAAPLTVMVGFAGLAFLLAGDIAPAGFLLGGIVYGTFAVGFTAMSRHVRNSGAFYAYIREGLGQIAGGSAAVTAYFVYAISQIGFSTAAGVFASDALDSLFGVTLSWKTCALLIGALAVGLGFMKVDFSAKVLGLLLPLEILALVVLAIGIVVHGVPEGYSFHTFNPGNWVTPTLGSLVVVTFGSYIGFEMTAIYSEEAKNPRKTVPRASYIAVGTLAIVYTIVSWVLLMGVGPKSLASVVGADPTGFVFALSTKYVGSYFTDILQIMIVTSFFCGILAMHNASTRYLFSLGRDEIVPVAFNRVFPRTQVPSTAGIVHSVLVLGVLAILAFFTNLNPYTQIVVWAITPLSTGIIALEIVTSIAVVAYFRRVKSDETVWHRIVAPVVSAILLTIALIAILVKMNLLTGLSGWANFFVISPLIVAAILGGGRALWMRSRGTRTPLRSDAVPTSQAQR